MGINKRNIIFLIIIFLSVPIIKNDYILHFFILSFIWGIVAESWNLIMGYAGIFNFGQIAFFTIGAFASGLLSIQLGITPLLGLLLGGISAAIVGFLIGLPSLKLKGEYIALITYSLHMLLSPLIYRGKMLGIQTGGFIWNIPSLEIFGYVFPRNQVLPWYYAGLLLFILFIYLIYRVINSPIGCAFVALRDAEPLAKSLGIDEYKYKLIIFSLSAFITGVMGSFYAYYVATISARMLGLDYFVKTLIMTILGGLGAFPGSAIAAFIITFGFEVMRPLGSYRIIILGVSVIVIIIYMPNGIMGLIQKLKEIYKINKHKLKN